MAKINAITNRSGSLTIDPGASGDSFIQYNINGTGEFRIGVDDTDSDAFVIAQGSALGTTNTFRMSAAGERTLPLQPAFLGTLSAQDANVTGNGTQYTMGQGNSVTNVYDQGGDFTTAGVFTAPVTGRYSFGTSQLWQAVSSATDMNYLIVTSNRSWSGIKFNPSTTHVSTSVLSNFTIFCDMDAADTCDTRMTLTGVGADTCDIFGSNADRRTVFFGRLVC